MAKNKQREPDSEEFTTSGGKLLRLHRPNSFDVLIIDRQFSNDRPSPPLKKTETAFGVEEVPDAQDEAYQREMALWSLEYGQQILDFYLLEYIDVEVPDEMPDVERTYRRMRRVGKKPPYDLEDPDERKLAFLRRHLTEEESARLQLRLRQLMRPSPEVVEAVEAAFRDDVPEPAADG